MDNRKHYRRILHTIRRVDVKCERILGMLDVVLGSRKDSLLESIKESARDMYMSSLEERRRTGKNIGIVKHD